MRFFLGTHRADWLARSDVPLFISAVQLRRRRRSFPRARREWALDSGGFTELNRHGTWTISAEQYAGEVRRWSARIGRLLWAAIQDWMCEPVVRAKTGKTVREHQLLTIESLRTLRALAPDLPWAPVLQGWTVDAYLEHIEMYAAAGFDLRAESIVGVGSVCRRQATQEAVRIVEAIGGAGIRIHAFGVKRQGLERFADRIVSADSMAWSFVARRRNIQLPGHTHKNCANCFDFAMEWHRGLLSRLNTEPEPAQVGMPW